MPAEPQQQQPPDLVVVSDLHLGEGKINEQGRYSPMEEFFFDDEFTRFLGFLRQLYSDDPDRLALVLNGDVFDFLTVVKVPGEEESRDFKVSAAEHRFGLNPTAGKSVYKLQQIAAGHRTFFRALAFFIAAGHRVIIIRGNHDLELYFDEVRQELLNQLSSVEGGPTPAQVAEQVEFHQWFYLEQGRVFIEHGHEYEASNSIRYPLRPLLPDRLSRREDEPVLDYPLGSLFVRYFYNGVSRIEPYLPKKASFEEWAGDLAAYNLLDLLHIVRNRYPFFIQALRNEATGGTSGPTTEGEDHQREDLAAVRQRVDPPELPALLGSLKVLPMKASKLRFVKELLRPLIKRLLSFLGIALVSLYIWLLLFNTIQLAESVFSKAILLVLFTLVSMGGMLWLVSAWRQRVRRQVDRTLDVLEDRAGKIADLTGVKMVLMGHTHVVDVRQLEEQGATYANSGTWTSVDNPWDRLHPDARRFTYLFVKGDEVQVRRWNDSAGRPESVPLFMLAARPQPPPPGPAMDSRRVRSPREPRR